MSPKTALITGAAGQDGRLLTEHLLQCGYRVFAFVRANTGFEETANPHIEVLSGDLRNRADVHDALNRSEPDELYNFAAMSSVANSWTCVEAVMATNLGGVVNVLEELRARLSTCRKVPRYYQASSSEMFGTPPEWPQTEATPLHPRSPYAVSKCAAHYLTINYRESYGLFACSGILYNHESPLRPATFVTRKISQGVAAIAKDRSRRLILGNVDVSRDWGHARDYVRAMHAMLQANDPDDYVVATGVSHTLAEFLQTAFSHIGIEDWEDYVVRDQALYRPLEVLNLVGDASKARLRLGWKPSTCFADLVTEMVDADLAVQDMYRSGNP